MDPDRRIRAAAFAAIEKLSQQWGGQVPWEAIREGFQADGETVLFANCVIRGILNAESGGS